jgi:hypothetical protein
MNLEGNSISHKFFCFFVFTLSLIVTYYFVISGKAFIADSGVTFLDLISKEKLQLHLPLHRYSNTLIQLPTYLFSLLGPIDTDLRFLIAKNIFSYSYALFPLFFLYFFLLKYYKNPQNSFFLYPIFSYFYLYIITDNFIFNIASETVSWSWAAAYILQKNKFRSIDAFYFSIFSCIIFFSYETGLLVLAYFYISLFKKFRENKISTKERKYYFVECILIILILFQFAHIVNLQFFHFKSQVFSFYQSVPGVLAPQIIFFFTPIIIIIALNFSKSKINYLICFSLIAYSIYFLNYEVELMDKIRASFQMRVWIVPIALALIMAQKQLKIKLNKILFIAFTFTFSYLSIQTSLAQLKTRQTISSIGEEGVFAIEPHPQLKMLNNNGYISWTILTESLIYGETLTPRRLYVHTLENLKNFCYKNSTSEHNWLIKNRFIHYSKIFNLSKLNKCK